MIAGPLNDRFTKQHPFLLFLCIYVCHNAVFSFFRRKIHQVSSYFVTNEVAHTYLILRGNKCSSKTQNGESVNQMSDHSVIRVFLWPRNPVCGKSFVLRCTYASNQWNFFETSCSALLHSLNLGKGANGHFLSIAMSIMNKENKDSNNNDNDDQGDDNDYDDDEQGRFDGDRRSTTDDCRPMTDDRQPWDRRSITTMITIMRRQRQWWRRCCIANTFCTGEHINCKNSVVLFSF